MNPRTIATTSLRQSLAWPALLGACGLAGFVTLSAWAAPEPAYPALGSGLSLVERQYLFDAELQGDRLFGEALKVFSRDFLDVSVRKAGEHSWELRSPDCEVTVAVPQGPGIALLEAPLSNVGRFLESCSRNRPPELPRMDSYLLSGVMSGLDPYSVVFDEKHQAEHNIQYQGKLAGIGARIGQRKGQLTLIEVYADSPASRAGLRDDDEVLRINDLSTRNIPTADAVERIRGEEGSRVTLQVRRKDVAEPLSVVVTRGIVMIPSVKSRMLGGDVLYTEITNFSQTTPDDFRQHLARGMEDHSLRGVVIDLRRNSGGSMMGSAAIGDLFLKEGLLISTAGRGGQKAQGLTPEVRATGNAMAPDLPVVFLMSPMTASGSELLAASLRNNDRALVLGEHSFGKGCIQKTLPIDDSVTLKLTVGNFLPNGRPIPGSGLVPDVEVVDYRVGTGHLLTPVPPRSGDDMPFWLRTPSWALPDPSRTSWRMAFAEDFPDNDPLLADRDELDPPEETKPDPNKPDRLLEVAAALLRNHGDASASRMLERGREFLQRTVETAEADLADFLAARGLDWTPGPRPNVAAAFGVEAVARQPLVAGAQVEVEVRVVNRSAAPFYRLRGTFSSTSAAFDGQSIALGRIEPGGTRAWTMKVKVPGSARTGRARLELRLFDDDGEVAKLPPLRLAVQETPRPHLAMRAQVTQLPEDPTRIDIALDVENRGDGPTSKVVVRLKHPLKEQFEILEGAGDVPSLEPGAKASFVLKARLLGSFDAVPEATVYVSEGRHALFLERSFALAPAGAAAAKAEAAVQAAGAPDAGDARPGALEAAALPGAAAALPGAADAKPAGAVAAASSPAAPLVQGAWDEAPRIRIEGIDDKGDGRYEVRVTASDDHALAKVRARLDDDTVAYVEPQGTDRRSATLTLPWSPEDDVKKLRIEAVDDSGLRELYAGSL